MTFVPPWSTFTLPRRGRICEIDVDVEEALAVEYRMARRARNAATVAARDPDSIIHQRAIFNDDGDAEDSGYSSSDSSASSRSDSIMDTDSDGSDYSSDTALPSSDPPPILRPRPESTPFVDVDVNPFPDSFTASHLVGLGSLGFKRVQWREQPGVLVDLRDRIGAMYIGRPSQASAWENAIIYGGQDMLAAQESISQCVGFAVDKLSAGVKCGGPGGNRPQNIGAQQPVSIEHVARATLRNSPHIQTITSFQNAALQKMAPNVWSSSKRMLQQLLEHDPSLRLPFDFAAAHGQPQPTAFSRIDYRFTIDGFLRQEDASYTPGFTTLTALGNYHHDEGELVLWRQKKVVNFPVGSTFLIPKWMPYSFTAVESPGYQMILSQTCENALSEYVANDFSTEFPLVAEGEMEQEARYGAGLYQTLRDYDEQRRLRSGGNVPTAPTPNPPTNSMRNPWLVDENGEIVRNLRTARRGDGPSNGPPSLIRQDIPRISAAEIEARRQRQGAPASPARQDARVARRGSPYLASPYHPVTGVYIGLSATTMAENRAPSSAATSVRRPNGWRRPRPTPLLPSDLYTTEARPPLVTPSKEEFKCVLCDQIKSNPVRSKCGHTHCYVCIRIHVETSWNCPSCDVIMTRAPKRDTDDELWIQLNHTSWIDQSRVLGTWDGLLFPQLPRRAVSTP
ncbi:hypothetical protein C8R47DRAFT_1213796 [Mycena vitilis]|nr:hypothetical protein C8R47DRAFT_1213796 [Mycena vitilis]